MSRHVLKTSILVALSVAACSAQDGAADEASAPAAKIEDKRTLPETSKDPTVKALVDTAIVDLVDHLEQQETDPGEIRVLESKRVTWRSAAVGCPQPDRGYQMRLMPGVLIRLRAAGQVFEYHSTLRGPPFLCDPELAESPAPDHPSLDPT
jgi:hypothetical protein